MSWKKVGKIKEAHGLKGELWAVIFDKGFEEFDAVESFGVGPGDEPARVFEEGSLRPRAKGVIARSPELTDRNAAEALLNQFLFVPEDAVALAINEDPEYKSLLGFTLFDGEAPVGTVESFSELKEQILVHVRAGDEVFDIPFHDDFLEDILDDEKRILMTLPPGLLEINRSGAAAGRDEGGEE